jgi:HEAT repeat protein
MSIDQFEDVLADLGAGRGPKSPHLVLLSDLADNQLERFAAVWMALGEEQKLELLEALSRNESKEARLDFNAAYHLGIADERPLVRRRAIEATVEDDSPWLLERLLALLTGDPDAGVRAAAAAGLEPFARRAELGELAPADSERIRHVLVQAIHRQEEQHNVLEAAVAGLGYFSDDVIRQELAAAFDNEALRLSALRGMGHSADPVWLETILDELHDSDDEVRQVAAQAAGEIGDEAAVEELSNLIDDSARAVRLTAIAALGEIGGAEAREALIYALQDEDETIRQAAEAALEEMEFFEEPLAT